MLSNTGRMFGGIFFCSVALIIISCGSTHQMMPPIKLHHKEYQANLVLSYDLNFISPLPSSGFNFYWGAGKDYVIGIGYQPPLLMTHLTGIKYLGQEKSPDTFIYGSLNGLSLGMMPAIELGAGFEKVNGMDIHKFSSGLAIYINGKPYSAFRYLISIPKSGAPFSSWPAIRPILKYEYSHNDFRFSFQNYMGLTELSIAALRSEHEQLEPLVIPYNEIDSIYIGSTNGNRGYAIILNNGCRYVISDRTPYHDSWGLSYLAYENRFTPDDETAYYFLNYNNGFSYRLYGKYEININQLMDDYRSGKDLVIQNKKANTRIIKKQIKWFLHDWSVAVGVSSSK